MNKKTKQSLINIGTGKDYTINYYAKLIAKIILKDSNIKLKYDKSKPNGTPQKSHGYFFSKKIWLAI